MVWPVRWLVPGLASMAEPYGLGAVLTCMDRACPALRRVGLSALLSDELV